MGQEYVEAHGPSFETVWGIAPLIPQKKTCYAQPSLIQPLLLFVSSSYKYSQPINFL